MSYTAVVETGSCRIDLDEYGERRWEASAQCGHRHRTREAAERCGEKLRAFNPKTRTCNAQWAYFRIHNEHGHRV